MKTADFINLFKTGRLGKKRQHSGYKVMDGEHCQLLVRATRKYGVPGGSELIAIYFGHGICLFHSNFNSIRDSVTDDVTAPKPVITSGILKESDESLIESGIIEFDDTKRLLLLEVGATPWLLEQDERYTPNKWAEWAWDYNTGSQVSRRVETIAEAAKDVALDDGVISAVGYMLWVLPSNFIPVTTSEADKQLMMNPPNPFELGLGFEDLIVRSVYSSNSTGCTPLFVKGTVLRSQQGASFKVAMQAYNAAVERFDDIEPGSWENITTDETGTILVGAEEQVYLKGHVSCRYKSSESVDLPTWHQVIRETTKLRLPLRC